MSPCYQCQVFLLILLTLFCLKSHCNFNTIQRYPLQGWWSQQCRQKSPPHQHRSIIKGAVLHLCSKKPFQEQLLKKKRTKSPSLILTSNFYRQNFHVNVYGTEGNNLIMNSSFELKHWRMSVLLQHHLLDKIISNKNI